MYFYTMIGIGIRSSDEPQPDAEHHSFCSYGKEVGSSGQHLQSILLHNDAGLVNRILSSLSS